MKIVSDLNSRQNITPTFCLFIRMVPFFKTIVIFSLKLLAILLIVLYQLTKFEAPTFFHFQDILNTRFQWAKLQRTITQKSI